MYVGRSDDDQNTHSCTILFNDNNIKKSYSSAILTFLFVSNIVISNDTIADTDKKNKNKYKYNNTCDTDNDIYIKKNTSLDNDNFL